MWKSLMWKLKNVANKKKLKHWQILCFENSDDLLIS